MREDLFGARLSYVMMVWVAFWAPVVDLVFVPQSKPGAFLGPTLGGFLSELVGPRTAYSSTGILEVALAVLLFFVAMTPAFRHGVHTARSPLLTA